MSAVRWWWRRWVKKGRERRGELHFSPLPGLICTGGGVFTNSPPLKKTPHQPPPPPHFSPSSLPLYTQNPHALKWTMASAAVRTASNAGVVESTRPGKKHATHSAQEEDEEEVDSAAAVLSEGMTKDVSADEPALALSIARAVHDLETLGYAVVPDVFGDAECTRIKHEMWSWMEKVTYSRVNRSSPFTWTAKCWPPNSRHIVQHYGVGHSRAAWLARTNLNVHRTFAALWGTDRLTVSYDGMNLWPAPEKVIEARGGRDEGYTATRWPMDSDWLHTDQSPYSPKRECIQAWATFEDVDGDDDATLKVIPGSHLIHEELCRKFNVRPLAPGDTGRADRRNWYKFTNAELCRIHGANWREKAVRVSAPRGSLVLWDSRTLHQGTAPRHGREVPRDRAVVYLCFAPEKNMTEAQRRKKRLAALALRTTSHWPCESKLFATRPNTYGKPMPPFHVQGGGRDDNDPVARKLCCLDAYGDEEGAGLLGWKHDRVPLLEFGQR